MCGATAAIYTVNGRARAKERKSEREIVVPVICNGFSQVCA